MDRVLLKDCYYFEDILSRYKPDENGWYIIKEVCRDTKFTLSYLELIISEIGKFEFNKNKTSIRFCKNL